jgi:hypothetical protein
MNESNKQPAGIINAQLKPLMETIQRSETTKIDSFACNVHAAV